MDLPEDSNLCSEALDYFELVRVSIEFEASVTDETFHFLFRYRNAMQQTDPNEILKIIRNH